MKKIYSLFLVLLIAFGCYEDKGNYNYQNIEKLTIGDMSGEDNIRKVTVGEDIIIKTTITPNVITNLSRYTFKWTLNGETKPEWNKKDFIWTTDRPTPTSLSQEELVFEIIDTRHGTRYTHRTYVTITSEFDSKKSFIILSEDEGKNSKLHFLKYLQVDSRPDPINPDRELTFPTSVKKYINIYETQNNNEPLGKGPIAIQQHYVYEPAGIQYCIFQESGAVDIEYNAIKKTNEFSASFDGGHYPEGTEYLNGGSLMWWMDIMSDQKGRLFSRLKFDQNLYNTGTFITKPIEYKGEILENCTVFRNSYTDNSSFQGTFIFNKNEGRFLFMFDGGVVTKIPHQHAGLIISVPNPVKDIPNGYRVFDNFKGCEILATNIQYGGSYGGPFNFHIVYKDELGRVMLQTASIKQENSTQPTLINVGAESHEITDAPIGLSKVVIPMIYNRRFIFFIAQNKIYFTDMTTQSYKAELYYTADSDITILSRRDQNSVVFGTIDGFFYEIDINDAKNKISSKVKDVDKLLYKEGGFGKIVDINFCEKRTH